MKYINYPDFAEFFQSKIAPALQPFEKERIKILKEVRTVEIIAFICFIFGFFFTFAFIPSLIMGFVVFIRSSNYKAKLKVNFYPKLYGLLGLEYNSNIETAYKVVDMIGTVCEKTNIYERYDNIVTDDIISGGYNGMPFTLSDVTISYTTGSGKNKHTVYVLKGLFLAIELEKKYKGETLIKTDKFFQAKEIYDKKAIKLEDIEFEKSFEVYGSDQIESRYLLTTAFMRRLLDYKNKKCCNIEIAFSKETGFHENAFFFIHTRKNHFELPINVSLLNQDLFYSLVKEITDIMEIIEALKLDQNIGL